MQSANDVQVRHAGLDHHDIGSLLDVESDLADGFVGIGRIHLISFLRGPPKVLCRADGVSKRTVECRRILSRIAHQDHVLKSSLIQRRSYGTDPAVHHVRRGNHARSCLGLQYRLLAEDFDGQIVDDGVVDHDPIVAMGCVGIQSHIANNTESILALLADSPSGTADKILGHESFVTALGFLRYRCDRKDRYGSDSKFRCTLGSVDRKINAHPLDPWHRRDRFGATGAFDDKNRPDQVGGRKLCFLDHSSNPVPTSHASQSGMRKLAKAR